MVFMELITVRYFAGLRERFGRSEERLDPNGLSRVVDVWVRVSREPMPANTLMAVNQEYARPETAVKPGDEVAFFPPVTGG